MTVGTASLVGEDSCGLLWMHGVMPSLSLLRNNGVTDTELHTKLKRLKDMTLLEEKVMSSFQLHESTIASTS